jgi:hypothetical protein
MTIVTAYGENNDNLAAAYPTTSSIKVEEISPTNSTKVVESQPIKRTTASNQVKGIHELIPDGWEIMIFGDPVKAVGDLNKDGIDDIALIIEQVESDTEEAPARALLIAFGTKNNGYTLSIIADNVVLNTDEGGVFGDPFDDLKIERGAVVVSDYGGSNWRWYHTYRFRFQDNDWYLIGLKSGSYFNGDSMPDEADEEDYNLLTGDYIIQYKNDEGNVTTKKGNRGKRELVKLRNFNMTDPAGLRREASLAYKNQLYGFTFTFPESWYQYYTVHEWNSGFDVYFTGDSITSRSSDYDQPVAGLYLFSIASEHFAEEEGFPLDDVTEIGQANGTKFYYFTATDCSICILGADYSELGEEELELMKSDWAKASTMREEIDELLNSFQSL